MKNQRGITLVEVLVTLALLSVLSSIVISITINTQNTFKRQEEVNYTTANLTMLLNSITTEVRMYPANVSVESGELRITPPSLPEIIYSHDATTHTLSRDGIPQLTGIEEFQLSLEGAALTVTIRDMKAKTLETRIVLRRGNQ